MDFFQNARDFSPLSAKKRAAWKKFSQLIKDTGVNSRQVANALGTNEMTAMLILRGDTSYVSLNDKMFLGMERLTRLSADFWREQFRD